MVSGMGANGWMGCRWAVAYSNQCMPDLSKKSLSGEQMFSALFSYIFYYSKGRGVYQKQEVTTKERA